MSIETMAEYMKEDWEQYISHMLDRLSPEYIRGYTAAIMMIRDQFNSVCQDLKRNRKRPTEAVVKDFLSVCLKERGTLRDFEDSFIRWNRNKKEFEVWRESWKKEDR